MLLVGGDRIMPNGPRIGRRDVLAGIAAAGALALAGAEPARAARPAGGLKGDPEPLQYFRGLREGFYGLGETVLYVDGQHLGFAPRGLDPSRLVPLELQTADLTALMQKLRKRRFVFAVEHAVLRRLYTDRPLALALLTAALAAQSSPATARLRHLRAAIESGRPIWRAVGPDGRAFPTTLTRSEEQLGPVF
jgi:hypothetical protein